MLLWIPARANARSMMTETFDTKINPTEFSSCDDARISNTGGSGTKA
jgi:hypothetical protein